MKRKGFTLVELLIVIVVIGILSAMMMMSSTEATTSAKATAIVSNLRNLKTAALAFYTDSMDYFVENASGTKNEKGQIDASGKVELRDLQPLIRKYLGANSNPDIGDYIVSSSGSNNGAWYVSYQIKGSDAEKASIKKKLAGRAKSLGLQGSKTGGLGTAISKLEEYKDQEFVVLKVR